MSDVVFSVNEIPTIVVVLFMFFTVIVFGLLGRKLCNTKKWKTIVFIAVTLWFAFLVWSTVVGREPWTRKISLIPFAEICKTNDWREALKGCFYNVLLFVPFGMTAPFLLKDYVKRPICETLICGFVISFVAELTQYIFAIGYSEMNDLMMNTLGVGVGTISFLITTYEKKDNKE